MSEIELPQIAGPWGRSQHFNCILLQCEYFALSLPRAHLGRGSQSKRVENKNSNKIMQGIGIWEYRQTQENNKKKLYVWVYGPLATRLGMLRTTNKREGNKKMLQCWAILVSGWKIKIIHSLMSLVKNKRNIYWAGRGIVRLEGFVQEGSDRECKIV